MNVGNQGVRQVLIAISLLGLGCSGEFSPILTFDGYKNHTINRYTTDAIDCGESQYDIGTSSGAPQNVYSSPEAINCIREMQVNGANAYVFFSYTSGELSRDKEWHSITTYQGAVSYFYYLERIGEPTHESSVQETSCSDPIISEGFDHYPPQLFFCDS